MPRKASARKAGSARKTAEKKSAAKPTDQTSATRGAQSFTDRNTQADVSKVDPNTPQGRRIRDLQGQINEQVALAQAPSAAKPDYGASTMKLGGVTKILREAGDENTGKPSPTHIVQQGGGGAVDGNSGQPVR